MKHFSRAVLLVLALIGAAAVLADLSGAYRQEEQAAYADGYEVGYRQGYFDGIVAAGAAGE